MVVWCVFAIVLFLRFLALRPLVLDVDESWFAASAFSLESHPLRFFSQAVDNKPPGTVWFFWMVEQVFGAHGDPRFARAVCLIVLLFVAWILSRATKLLDNRAASIKISILFLMATALPSPKQLGTTSEALLLPVHVLFFYSVLQSLDQQRGMSIQKSLALGLLTGFSLFIKQTAIFFIFWEIGLLSFLVFQSRLPWRSLLVFLSGIFATVFSGIWVLGPKVFWFWTYTYPRKVLANVRAALFTETSDFLFNSFVFTLIFWPLLTVSWKCLSRSRLSREVRYLLVGWICAGLCSILIGKGLFYHYYLVVLPPLCLLVASTDGFRPAFRWMLVPFVFIIGVASVPNLGVFWGVDHYYFERLGRQIRKLTTPEDRIFVWGGNAMALTSSGRKYSTPFITARYAAPPYGIELTHTLFQKEIIRNKPKLFIDLSERGDCRFNYPINRVPWLEKFLQLNYDKVEFTSLPWAKLYLRKDLTVADEHSRKILSQTLLDRSFASDGMNSYFEDFYRDLGKKIVQRVSEDQTFEFIRASADPITQLITFGTMLQIWDALQRWVAETKINTNNLILIEQVRDRLLDQVRIGNNSYAKIQSDSRWSREILSQLKQRYEKRQIPIPLSLESRFWWVSLALVKLQPVAN